MPRFKMDEMKATKFAGSRRMTVSSKNRGGAIKMTVVEKPRKKRIFIASSQADVAEVQKAMQQFDLDAVTLDQIATPGTTWVDSLHAA
jgi:predicted nucleotide-binding protein